MPTVPFRQNLQLPALCSPSLPGHFPTPSSLVSTGRVCTQGFGTCAGASWAPSICFYPRICWPASVSMSLQAVTQAGVSCCWAATQKAPASLRPCPPPPQPGPSLQRPLLGVWAFLNPAFLCPMSHFWIGNKLFIFVALSIGCSWGLG